MEFPSNGRAIRCSFPRLLICRLSFLSCLTFLPSCHVSVKRSSSRHVIQSLHPVAALDLGSVVGHGTYHGRRNGGRSGGTAVMDAQFLEWTSCRGDIRLEQ